MVFGEIGKYFLLFYPNLNPWFLAKYQHTLILVLFFLFLFFVFLPFLGPLPVAYGGSQARGLIGDVASGLCQSHSNSGSESCLEPTPHGNAGSLTH